jgi:hypothetical protein
MVLISCSAIRAFNKKDKNKGTSMNNLVEIFGDVDDFSSIKSLMRKAINH